MDARPEIALRAEQWDELFPFHFAVDAAGVFTRVGPALRKCCLRARPGDSLRSVFDPVGPGPSGTVPDPVAQTDRLIILQESAAPLRLRGQWVVVGAEFFFLGSPWVKDLADFAALDLSLNDFALHDPTLDLLHVLQLQQIVTADLRRLAAKLQEQGGKLSEALRAKDAFMAVVSHELRTPLAGILGLSETLIEGVAGPVNAKQAHYLGIVKSSGERLLGLVNDILDLARLTSGTDQVSRQEQPLAELCTASLETVRALAERRGQTVTFENRLTVATAPLDVRRIKQALDRLLNNAAKFTPEGGEFGLRATGGPEELRFEVWDRGIGIAPADMGRLFEPFVQLDSRRARRYNGAGLGLALVKALVEQHGGRVEVTSTEGIGSVFAVVLATASTRPA